MKQHLEYFDLSFLAYKRIKEMILSNKLAGGEKIIQEKLADELGVSRMPLHKAFQMLENEMLVESIPRRGIFVKKFDPQEAIDAFECREVFEGLAARRAATNITGEEVIELYNLFAPFEVNLAFADLAMYEEADFQFHSKIVKISGNKILQRLEMIGNILKKTYQRGLIRGPSETFQEHMDIIRALENHDGDKAEFYIRQHFKKSATQIKSLLQASKIVY